MWMFDRKELEGIIMLANVALKMERILNVIGIEQSAVERIGVLHLLDKARSLHSLTKASTEEKVEEILTQ
jgi:hypothetical protein